MLEVTGRQVTVRHPDRSLELEVDHHVAAALDPGDGAGRAVLDEVPAVGTERAVIPASDHHLAHLELPAGHVENQSGQLAVGHQQCSGPFIQRPAGGVRPGDHRIGTSGTPGCVPVGDDGIEGLPRRPGAHHLPGPFVAGQRLGHLPLPVVDHRPPLLEILLAVVVHQPHQRLTPVGAQPAEHATHVHRTVLIGIADQGYRSPACPRRRRETVQISGGQHRCLIDDDHRPGPQAAIRTIEIVQHRRHRGRRHTRRTAKARLTLQLQRRRGRHRAPDDRHTGRHVRRHHRLGRIRLAGSRATRHWQREPRRRAHRPNHRHLLSRQIRAVRQHRFHHVAAETQ
ncbi:MAG: hypothetical protein R2755_26505 [Acidimicrobiales bacterium]